MKIFNKLAELCQEQPNYIEAFVQILQNCVKPFLLDRSTDAGIYSSALVAFYADFGKSMKRLNVFFFFIEHQFKVIYFVFR